MTTATAPSTLDAGLDYAARGLHVVPIEPGCKRPLASLGRNWPASASNDPEQIARWFRAHPGAGLGVLLGPASGIIDFDEDDPQAGDDLLELFDGDMPIVPTFESARGKHRLFAYDVRLAAIKVAVVKVGALEIRIGAAASCQTVLPPTDGRRWLVGLDECDLLALPESVVEKILSAAGVKGGSVNGEGRKDWREIAEGVGEGSRNEMAAAFVGRLLGDLRDPFDDAAIGVQWKLIQAWNEQNQPPLGEGELRTTFDSILRSERAQRSDDDKLNVDHTEARAPIKNAESVGKKMRPLTMEVVIRRIEDAVDGWPRRVGSALFVDETNVGISWLESTSFLFGWLARRAGRIDWRRGVGCVTKEELFAELRRTAREYMAVELCPHVPLIDGHYYACPTPEPGDGSTLRKLLDRFCPSTDIDADLIKAAFATPMRGGSGGTNPAFIITSESGRGAGKTKLAAMIGHLYGGLLDFSKNEDIAAIKQRLLSPDGLSIRVALLDNVKSLRFSWAELEALITAPVISGRRLYVGEGRRPNTLTWFVTLNGASLSTDMAQRSVVVKIDQPKRSGDWEEETVNLIMENRQAILADVAAFFQARPTPLVEHTRWASWERDVLARLPEPSEAQAVILDRQGEADAENVEAEILRDYFADRLLDLQYDPQTEVVHIPVEIAAGWFNRATNERHKTAAVTRLLKQLEGEKKITWLKANPSRAKGRGFLWMGGQVGPNTFTHYDLASRIETLRRVSHRYA